jgi:hypothetical protein
MTWATAGVVFLTTLVMVEEYISSNCLSSGTIIFDSFSYVSISGSIQIPVQKEKHAILAGNRLSLFAFRVVLCYLRGSENIRAAFTTKGTKDFTKDTKAQMIYLLPLSFFKERGLGVSSFKNYLCTFKISAFRLL